MAKTRPSKATKSDLVERLCSAIRMGATYRVACGYAGIHESTFYRWLDSGGPAAEEIRKSIQKAEADAALHWLSQIETAAKQGSWQAAAWRLERRYPKDFGRRTIVVQEEPAALAVDWDGGDEKKEEGE